MLKSIPKSSITKRKFQVYKLWNASQGTYPAELISGSNPLYRSIRSKYYSNLDGNVFNTFGSYKNIAQISEERQLSDTIYVIDIDRNKFGELIRKKSVRLRTANGDEYTDDGFGKLINPIPTYNFTKFDAELGILTIEQNSVEYDIDVVTFDLQSGGIVLLDDGDAETYFVVSINFETGIIVFTYELDFENIAIQSLSYGNVFYSDGVIVIRGDMDLSSYELEYRSTQTIYETEILVSVKAGEFNYSQNPSAVDVTLSGSYYFETTPILNVSPAKNVKIKEILDIEQRRFYSGSIDSTKVGTWNDYYNSSSVDPTGSYLAPYITTIGLYDDNGDMVAVAKLPQPIKNLPDYDLNFLIRFDT
jgi:hypothetical protein